MNDKSKAPGFMPFALSLSKGECTKQINFIGASPTASHFFLRRQDNVVSVETNLQVMSEPKSNQKEGDPGLWLRHNLKVSLRRNKLLRSVLSPLRSTLRCSTGQAAAELALLA